MECLENPFFVDTPTGCKIFSINVKAILQNRKVISYPSRVVVSQLDNEYVHAMSPVRNCRFLCDQRRTLSIEAAVKSIFDKSEESINLST